MTNNAAPPAQEERQPSQQPSQDGAEMQGDDLQRLISQALQPALTQLQQQMVQEAEQQLAPLRSRIQRLAEQELAATVRDTHQQQAHSQPSSQNGRGAVATKQQESAAPVEAQQDEGAQQQSEPALVRWGETLEGAAVIVLALGEVLDGIALLMQAVGQMTGGGYPSQPEQEGDASSQQEEGGESLLQKVGGAVSSSASSLKQAAGHVLGGDSSSQKQESSLGEQQEDSAQKEEKGEESMLGKLGEAVSSSASSLKHAAGHVLGDGPSSAQQWGRILGSASALAVALSEALSSQHGKSGGLSALPRWSRVMKHATTLWHELRQVWGDGASFQHGQGKEASSLQRAGQILGGASSLMESFSGGSSTQDRQDDGGSSSHKEQDGGGSSQKGKGGLPAPLKALAGGESSEKKEGDGSSLIDALTGEDSPLQMLREFSKRQQGPGGLAPKGPIGRKPPPGPLRRDRLPGAQSNPQ